VVHTHWYHNAGEAIKICLAGRGMAAVSLQMAWMPRPVDIVNKTISTVGLRVIRNIPFGRHMRQKLDIYTPASLGPLFANRGIPVEPLPVIVFFYGGSWQWGERRDYQFVAASLAKRGFVVVVPDYRLHPEVKFPVFLEDGAAAVAWVFKNIPTYGGDTGALFMMGHSAGAYNAVMLALDGSYLDRSGIDAARIAGVIGLAGPYDFLPSHDPVIAEIFSGPAEEKTTQPVSFVREGAPPALLLHGGRDKKVLPRNTAVLAARLREAGSAVETRISPKLGHTGILLASLPHFAWRRARPQQDVLHFIAACRQGEFADLSSDISAPMLR
jgi:acetyl esterase/lipase